MRTARGGAADPSLAQDEETGYSTEREQVVPFFDFEPELLYPLLDHEGINQVSSACSEQCCPSQSPAGISTRAGLLIALMWGAWADL